MKFNIPPRSQYHQKWKTFEAAHEIKVKARTVAATERFLQLVGRTLQYHLKSPNAHLHYIEFKNIPTEVSFSAAKAQLEKLGYSITENWSAHQMTIYFN